ncbi:nitroreductase [Sphingomonas oligophenolica]|uniref:nitroreductase n=1 Tax=Sphingomonas oligophenolica TaxID=301154 RepID=UPI001F4FEF22|nr:nitroreductase [Sphingomonas oligophenolica]
MRELAEEEERDFYATRASPDWLDALVPLGTDPSKTFLDDAPWLIAIFGERYGVTTEGAQVKHCYVPESIGIATGFLVAALHECGLAALTRTPSPMGLLNEALERPAQEKPYILLVVGHPADDATVPEHALTKLPLDTVLTYR